MKVVLKLASFGLGDGRTSKRMAICVPVVQAVYGCLTEDRKQELRDVCNAVSTDQKMRKVYSVLNYLGFDTWGDRVCAHDRATLTLIEKYVKFKQGEVWMEMETKFNTSGFRPTGPDRARLQSGIHFSEHLATIVMKDQMRLLITEQHELGKKERERLQAKLAQAQLEYDIKCVINLPQSHSSLMKMSSVTILHHLAASMCTVIRQFIA